MVFRVILEKVEGEGYSVYCPTLKGCWSQGNTVEEALENIKDAIKTYLESLKEITKSKQTYDVEVGV